MRRTLALTSLILFLSGCGGGTPNPNNQPQAGQVGPVAQQPWSTPAPAQQQLYRGQTAAQWGERLLGPDAKRRHEATRALTQLKEEGTPYLLKGLRSESSDLQLTCLEALPFEEMVRHEKDVLPTLLPMLQDKNAALRQLAVARLAWFGKNARSALPTLQHLAQNDPSDAVRDAARGSITDIQDAITGKRRPDG